MAGGIAAAVAVNALYGAATGESGGLVGEAFGVQDKIDTQQAKAKEDAANRQAQLVSAIQSTQTKAPAVEVTPAPVIPPSPILPPVVEPVKTMPTINDATVTGVKRASITEQRRRQGRASTILTGNSLDSDKLGG